MQSIFSNTRFDITSQQVHTHLDQNVYLVNVATRRQFFMTEFGAHVWALLKEGKSVSEIHDFLIETLELDHSSSLERLRRLITTLNLEGFIRIRSTMPLIAMAQPPFGETSQEFSETHYIRAG